MIYLPKTFERYLSALRLYVQMSVLKDRDGAKHLAQLKKISLAEVHLVPFVLLQNGKDMELVKFF